MDSPLLRITVTNPEKHVDGVVSYISFAIITYTNLPNFQGKEDGASLEVRRRYSDFVWLRSQLVASHPEIIVPPIPSKMSEKFRDRFTPDFLEKRRKGLELFLNRISLHPVLITSLDLNTFLCAKEWELRTVQSESENVSSLASLTQKLSAMKVIKTVSEDPELERFENVRKYFSNLNTHLQKTCEHVESIHKKNQEFIADYTSLGPYFMWLAESETELCHSLSAIGRVYTEQLVPYFNELIQQQEFGLLQALQQYVFTCEAGLEVLLRRDILHAECITASRNLEATRAELARTQQEQLNAGSASATSSGFSLFKISFEDPQQKIQRLELKSEQEEVALQNKKKELEKASATILSEIERFHKWKTSDFQQFLQDLVQTEMEFHRKVQGAWAEVIPEIEELSLDNIRKTFWMTSSRQSLRASME